MECHHSHWLILFKMVQTTNQSVFIRFWQYLFRNDQQISSCFSATVAHRLVSPFGSAHCVWITACRVWLRVRATGRWLIAKSPIDDSGKHGSLKIKIRTSKSPVVVHDFPYWNCLGRMHLTCWYYPTDGYIPNKKSTYADLSQEIDRNPTKVSGDPKKSQRHPRNETNNRPLWMNMLIVWNCTVIYQPNDELARASNCIETWGVQR